MTKMYRCKFLAHGLFVSYDHFRHCHLSIHAPDARRQNWISDYKGPGDKVNWQHIFDTKKELVTQMRNGDFPEYCEGCAWIEEFDNPEDYKSDYDEYFDMLWLCHFNHCNCNCIYCCAYEDIKNKTTKKGFDVIPLLKELAKNKIYVKNGIVSFGLGEPTILRNFDKIIKMLRENGFKNFVVYTNGIAYSKVLTDCMKHDDTSIRVVISLDSGTREVYKKIKKVDCFDKVCKNIEKYMSVAKGTNETMFQVKYIIVPGINDSKEEIDKWFDLCVNKYGVKSIIADIEEDWFIVNRDCIPDHIRDLCIYMKEKSEENGLLFEFYDRAQILKIK